MLRALCLRQASSKFVLYVFVFHPSLLLVGDKLTGGSYNPSLTSFLCVLLGCLFVVSRFRPRAFTLSYVLSPSYFFHCETGRPRLPKLCLNLQSSRLCLECRDHR